VRRVLLALLITLPLYGATKPTACTACHTAIEHFGNDVHSQVGLSCHDCHGGNPNAAADDMNAAMDPKFKPNPFRPAPKRVEIPEFCGRCHSSAETMKRFNPAARIDQVTEYWTSVHGQRLKTGDQNVATCVDCHSVHDIRRKSNPDSPVYATHVAETCSRCHSDTKRMAQYGIPTDQYARWKVSVHANALLNKGDLVAPTCNDCHGNHGATPPGVQSVVFVCGSCHTREAELFRKSAKQAGWANHNDLLAAGQKCADCHDDARGHVDVKQFAECVTCHENHSVIRPTAAMIGSRPDAPCVFCHEGQGALVAEPAAKANHYREMRASLESAADRQNLKGDTRFDWLVDQALQLPTHRLSKTALRPEFERLFEKFRIGKTQYQFGDVKISVRRCSDCHVDNAVGKAFIADYGNLTGSIARAERILLSAYRGGVEVRQARAELDSAVDNQIELESLVHTFAIQGDREAKKKEGMEHAKAALATAQQSLDELQYRRKGLFIALGVILAVLAALALKIRTL
jgi:hypothetical protein